MSKKSRNRREEISKIVLSEGTVRVKELSEILKVSMETIRKDLDFLSVTGAIRKEHGTAMVVKDYFQLPIDAKLQENVEAKKRIARAALDLIEDNSFVYLDPGSTSIQVAKLLKIKKNLTIITNSLQVAMIIADSQNSLIVCGGLLQKRGKSLVGLYALDVIDTVHIDLAIMGSDGFKGLDGFTTFSLEEADVRRHILRQSDVNVVVCDASKFEKTSTYVVGKFSEYDYAITDEQDPEKLNYLSEVKQVLTVRGEEQ